jgi:dolichol-phosphate mannosyltransferase
MHFHHIKSSDDIPAHIEAAAGATFITPTFELAEALIARGADSARVAISPIAPSDESYPGYTEAIPNGPLVPLTPFRFDRSVLIVLPTYNERQNLGALIHAIGRYVVADILVVDDNSPDGTGQIADELSQQNPHVHVLHRNKKEGLGPAYVAGFQWALARGYQSIIEMDCDFSHAPWDLPRMVHRSATADMVIGSRYVPGGGTENWNRQRRLVSKLGNTYVRLFLGSRIHDWTGGFRCFRHELLAQMGTTGVKAKGYVFQVEMAWRALLLDADVREIPIRFRDRAHGHSKLGWPTIFEALKEVPLLSFQTRASL